MIGLLLPVVVAAIVATLWAGSVAGLRRLRIDWWPLAVLSLGVQLIIHNPPFNQQEWALAWGPGIWVVCLGAILTMLVRNALNSCAARAAWTFAALGVGLNLLVVLANGGYMPQSAEARALARGTSLPENANRAQLYNVTPIGPETQLVWLSDVIAQPGWLPRSNVVSAGDLVLSAALALLAFQTIAAGASQVRGRTADS
jgi:hypothetical protein